MTSGWTQPLRGAPRAAAPAPAQVHRQVFRNETELPVRPLKRTALRLGLEACFSSALLSVVSCVRDSPSSVGGTFLTEGCSCKLTTPNGYYYISLCCKVCFFFSFFFFINVGSFPSFKSSYFLKETKKMFCLFFPPVCAACAHVEMRLCSSVQILCPPSVHVPTCQKLSSFLSFHFFSRVFVLTLGPVCGSLRYYHLPPGEGALVLENSFFLPFFFKLK